MKSDEQRSFEERIQSIQSSLHDIDRWLVQALCAGRLSVDRRHDIEYHAKRIAESVGKL